MAKRPVFIPYPDQAPFVKTEWVEFQWFPGFAKAQAQRSIESLHAAAAQCGIAPILEISSRSPSQSGVDLSAFNLKLKSKTKQVMTVECAFQGSKVFEKGGPYIDLYTASSKQAKTDKRLQNSGRLIGFRILGMAFPTQPATAFYDWLYLKALEQNEALAQETMHYQGFTDIVFNPEKSLNCQARSAALYVALIQNGAFAEAMKQPDKYLTLIRGETEPAEPQDPAHQLRLI